VAAHGVHVGHRGEVQDHKLNLVYAVGTSKPANSNNQQGDRPSRCTQLAPAVMPAGSVDGCHTGAQSGVGAAAAADRSVQASWVVQKTRQALSSTMALTVTVSDEHTP